MYKEASQDKDFITKVESATRSFGKTTKEDDCDFKVG